MPLREAEFGSDQIAGPGVDSLAMLPDHFEASAFVAALPDIVFAYADDPARLSSHMSQSSWMMAGSRMEIELDANRGQTVGSHIRLRGKVFGLKLSLDEVVTERVPPQRKVWQTTGLPRLLVIGPYRMGFEIVPEENGSLLRVYIDYALPGDAPARWLGWLFGSFYARWCTQRMVSDAVKRFASTLDLDKDASA
jgi:polyketide cyclase/dehydrase/lipid transport protein